MDGKILEKNKKGIILVAIIILLIIAGLFYLFLPTKPKSVFTTAINKVSNMSFDKNDKVLGANVSMDTDIHSNNKNQEKIFNIINDLDISYNFLMDSDKKQAHISLDTKYEDKNLLGATMDLKDEKAYLFLKDLYSKNLIIPMDGIEAIYNLSNKEDYKIIVNQISKALEKSLKDKYFSKESSKLELDGKKVKVDKYILKINNENIKEIAQVLSDELNNDEFIDAFARVVKYSSDEVKEALEEMKGEDVSLDDDIFVSIYLKGKKYIGFEIADSKEKLAIYKETNTKYLYDITLNKKSYKGNIEINGVKKNFDIKVTFDIEGINGSVTMKVKDLENINFPEIDTKNSVELDSLSQKDQISIYENLEKNEGLISLIENFSK